MTVDAAQISFNDTLTLILEALLDTVKKFYAIPPTIGLKLSRSALFQGSRNICVRHSELYQLILFPGTMSDPLFLISCGFPAAFMWEVLVRI